jgi:hypothetical protein
MTPKLRCVASLALAVFLSALAGCPIRFPEELNVEVNKGDEIFFEEAPADFGQADFLLTPDATDIPDVAVIPVEIVPDISVITFENFTDFDIAIGYFIEGIPQSVLLPIGQAVSIEYDPCLADLQLDYEDDFDPVSGLYAGSFDLSDVALLEGSDYFCGDEIFFTFEPDAVFVAAQPI